MSDENKNNLAVEKEKLVVVTPDDAKSAFDFWAQFDVPVMPGLREAFEAFQANPSYENQQRMKLMVVKAISTTDHPCFVDETFQKVREECTDVSYNMEFDEELHRTLSGEEKDEVSNRMNHHVTNLTNSSKKEVK